MLSVLMTVFKVMFIIAAVCFGLGAVCFFIGFKNEAPTWKSLGNIAVSIATIGFILSGTAWLITWILSLIF